jgi:hypothetical protein
MRDILVRAMKEVRATLIRMKACTAIRKRLEQLIER